MAKLLWEAINRIVMQFQTSTNSSKVSHSKRVGLTY